MKVLKRYVFFISGFVLTGLVICAITFAILENVRPSAIADVIVSVPVCKGMDYYVNQANDILSRKRVPGYGSIMNGDQAFAACESYTQAVVELAIEIHRIECLKCYPKVSNERR